MTFQKNNKLFIALDIDGVLNSHKDHLLLSKLKTINISENGFLCIDGQTLRFADRMNFVNMHQLTQFQKVVFDFLNQSKDNICHVVIISSWYPFFMDKTHDENNQFFKSFLFPDFNNRLIVTGNKVTIGDGQKRFDAFKEQCVDNCIAFYLDDIVVPNPAFDKGYLWIPEISEKTGISDVQFTLMKEEITKLKHF